jgi:hypothetical protein
MRMRRWVVLLPFVFAAASCGMFHHYTDAEIPSVHKLSDLMWAQRQATNPAFHRIGKKTLDDADYAVINTAGERLRLTAPRLKEKGFTKGPEYDAFADQLAEEGSNMVAAAAAKDAAKSQAALTAAKSTCAACHKKFK